MWSQFMNFQEPAMQKMMATYMDQSKKMVHQMQDQLKTQTLNMFSGLQIPGFTAENEKKPGNSDE
jgi:polyhydroxyalkanoate synthesis regulator protein